MAQLHKKFTDDQIKELIERYLNKEIERTYLQDILAIRKRRFFSLVKSYRDNPETFSIQYTRRIKTRAIPQSTENNIIKELTIEKKLIEDATIPLRSYNYSYIRDCLEKKYKQKVSLPTIINRAKKNNFYLKRPKRTIHDREVLTNYAGEIIQHDSSYHKWSPYAQEKWYLITSLDDFSRYLLYAKLLKHETSWAHICALEAVMLKHGFPYSYYVDCHSIFRYVQGRDSFWRKHHTLTDEADPQWKQVLHDCNVRITYALSPQAKGKIERPYGWLQDRLVRTCAREHITDIRHAQRALNHEIYRYNNRQVHSTTGEIPSVRLHRALANNKSLFRSFALRPPYQSIKDIFCLRVNRTINAYRKISLNNMELKVNGAVPGETVNLRIYPINPVIAEVRFWCNNKLIDVQKLKNTDLKTVHF